MVNGHSIFHSLDRGTWWCSTFFNALSTNSLEVAYLTTMMTLRCLPTTMGGLVVVLTAPVTTITPTLHISGQLYLVDVFCALFCTRTALQLSRIRGSRDCRTAGSQQGLPVELVLPWFSLGMKEPVGDPVYRRQ